MQSLCDTCAQMREVISGRGSRFLLCQLAQRDRRFAKYPPQPIARCAGYQAAAREDKGAGPREQASAT